MSSLDGTPPRFGEGVTHNHSFALRSPGGNDRFTGAAGLSTSGRTTFPRDANLYDPPATSRLTRSNVRLGDPLSPFVSEVMRPHQGIIAEKKYEVPIARARYTKGRDMVNKGDANVNTTIPQNHPSLFASNSSMRLYASTARRLRKPTPWENTHPSEFKRASRQVGPSDRQEMFYRKTLEEAQTPLERRRALEHEAALAHVEKRRIAAIEDAALRKKEREVATALDIKSDFATRRVLNATTRNAAYAWEADIVADGKHDPGVGAKTSPKKYQPFLDAFITPSHALHAGARQVVPRPRVLGPCTFVPLPATDKTEQVRLATTVDERCYENAAHALETTARNLGGVAPTAKYAAYFGDFVRSHREEQRTAGVRVHTHTAVRSLRADAQKKDQDTQMAELDKFETNVAYFHANDLRQRLTHRGWLGPGEGVLERSRCGAMTLVTNVTNQTKEKEKENPRASMVRLKAARDAKTAVANARKWDDGDETVEDY